MIMTAVTGPERKVWGSAAGVALALHGVVATAAVLLAVPHSPPVPEPVVLVDLPPAPPSAAAPVAVNQPQAVASVQPVTHLATQSRVDAPLVRTLVPADAVTLPPPVPVQRAAPAEARPALQPAAAPALSRPDSAAPASVGAGSDPRAKAREADYFATLSAYLNRRKSYPADARQARQQGIVTVRFTVDRTGGVSAISLKKSSGHAVLDDATLALLQRVAPLPKMPASMARDSITLSLPIEYSLRTN